MISVCRSILGDYEQWGSEVRRIVVFRMDAIANRGGVWAPGRRWLSSFLGLGLQTAPALRRGYWRHTLGYFLPRRPTWRRLDPRSSRSATHTGHRISPSMNRPKIFQ